MYDPYITIIKNSTLSTDHINALIQWVRQYDNNVYIEEKQMVLSKIILQEHLYLLNHLIKETAPTEMIDRTLQNMCQILDLEKKNRKIDNSTYPQLRNLILEETKIFYKIQTYSDFNTWLDKFKSKINELYTEE